MERRPLDPWALAWPAPAKLNLFLHVVGRRADGYHLLQSVFRLIDLADTLRFAPRTDGEVRRATGAEGVPEDEDLVVRAARSLKAATGCAAGVTISVEKRIPMGGGLGGGSSDAATTLAALNRLWGLGLPVAELMRIGLALGADVPFFLLGRNAFVEGVGERLHPIDLPPAWYVVLVPGIAVPTREIFAAPELTRDTKPIKIQGFSTSAGRNDLEPVVRRRYPAVARAIDWLSGLGDARMTGSGACVFAEFRTEREARAVLSRMPADMCGVVARGLDHHPISDLPGDAGQLGSRQVG
ncbi:MAG: 4-(cytidine 5'-diphospho)-2-C-methyl-D-erythritol kinase [Burkholderiales bacterium]|nr:4-(cytidine 5'-diphospho)-2-C-methyl-D-erythritol kinase [Burkholderiales bacterium]